VGSGLTGVLYVLDEPTIGLHPRDTHKLIRALGKLRDLGNTLVVVEHDRDVVNAADHALDFGPGSGREGGRIVAHAAPVKLETTKHSVTGPYLRTRRASDAVLEKKRLHGRREPGEWLEIRGIRHRTLKGIDAKIPLGVLTAVTGPSGSGKTSLVLEVLWRALARRLHAAREQPGQHDSVHGLDAIDKVILVDQEAIGSTPGSTPATYTGVFDHIRQLYCRRRPRPALAGSRRRRRSIQRAGRPLRGLRGARSAPRGDALSAGRVGDLRSLQGAAVFGRDAPRQVAWQIHRRRPGDERGRCGPTSSTPSRTSPAFSAHSSTWASATSRSGSRPRSSPVVKPSG